MSDRIALIASLRTTQEQTLPFFRCAPAITDRSYAPGKWSMRQLLVHLADHESVVLDRMRRIAADAGPTLGLPNYDQDHWATGLVYARRSLALAEQLYQSSRSTIIELLEILPASCDARSGLHSVRGMMTLLDTGDTWRHNQHHLAQLRAIAAGNTWAAATH